MYVSNQYQLAELVPSDHAEWRMAQRNVSWTDLEFVLDHGEKIYRHGVIFFYLRRCDIPLGLRKKYGRLEGATVVFNGQTHEIITVYRSHRQKGLRRVKSKPTRNFKSKWHYH